MFDMLRNEKEVFKQISNHRVDPFIRTARDQVEEFFEMIVTPQMSTVPQQGVPASLGGQTRFHGRMATSQAQATHVEDNR